MTQSKPMKHQLVSLAHDAKSPIVFDTSDQGTGKTFVRIMAFAKRRRAGSACLLVVCPKSLMTSVWKADFKKFAPDMKCVVATASNREKAFGEKADVYITNHDAAIWLSKRHSSFFDWFDELVIDESTAYKHHTSARSRAMAKVARYFERRTAMTATPNTRSITDVWHQVYLLDQGKRLGPNFYDFRKACCTPIQVGANPNALRWEEKDGAEDAVFGLLQDISIRHTREKCTDIPEMQVYEVTFALSAKHRAQYDRMENDQLLKAGKEEIVALNAAEVANKLMQVASGSVYDAAGKTHVIDSNRYELVLDLAEARPHSLVYFLWKHQRDALVEEARARKLEVCVIDGDTSDEDRALIAKHYQEGAYDVMFAHPKAVAHGYTLTRGTSTIWASPTVDLEWWAQGNRRQSRIGQDRKTEVIVVLGENTIDEHIYHELLSRKERKMKRLQDLLASIRHKEVA